MRLGAPIFANHESPTDWASAVTTAGYRAAYCPLQPDGGASDREIAAYETAAAEADIIIAEVGAWSNPLDPDDKRREAAMVKCIGALAMAERIGARCAVNIAGSRSETWHGPHPQDMTPETFDMIVGVVRRIIDEVNPTRTSYALETMPWMYPDSPERYLELMDAIDRPAFAVHFDPVNMVSSPERYFHNAEFVRECVRLLGPRMKSVHLKDATMSGEFLVHLDECRPGTGSMDYRALLSALDALDSDLPVMLEHLPTAKEYAAAAGYVRTVAKELDIRL